MQGNRFKNIQVNQHSRDGDPTPSKSPPNSGETWLPA
jgi:hypothetical protein